MDEENVFLTRLLGLSSINSTDNLMIKDKKITGNLKDVLNNLEEEQLDIILKMYFDDVKVLKKSISNKKKTLEDAIISKANNIFNILDYNQYKVLDAITNNEGATNVSDLLIYTGIIYSYTYKEKEYYFVPNDIKEIFKEFVKDDGYKKVLKNDLENHRLNMFYSLGLVPKDLLIDSYLDSGCTSSLINECIDNLSNEFTILNINNKEYYFPSNFTYSNTYSNNIENRKYIKRSLVLYDTYAVIISTLYVNIIKELKDIDSKDIYLFAIPTITAKKRPLEKIVNDFVKKYNLSPSKKKKIKEIIEGVYDDIRFWDIGGKTIEEETLDIFIIKKPKTNSLSNCLNSLNKKAKDMLLENCMTNDASLLDEFIIEDFINDCSYYFYDENELNEVLELDNKIFNGNAIITSFVLNGYTYLYKDDNDFKVLIPKEIKDCLKNVDLDDLIIDEDVENFNEIVNIYMCYNGIIYKKELQRILKENNNLDYTITELDNIIETSGMLVYDDYYSICESKNILEQVVLSNKENFKNYKKVDINNYEELSIVSDLEDSVSSFLESINIKDDDIVNIYFVIMLLINTNLYDDNALRKYLTDMKIYINRKDYRKLCKIINKYKNDIPIWTYNGYTQRELNDMSKD